MSTTCAFTVARAMKPRVIMAKVVHVDEDGMITNVEPSPQGFLFDFREIEVSCLRSLADGVKAAARDPYSIVVRGQPKQAVGRRAMYDDPEKGPANLRVKSRRWVAFDWDDVAVPHNPDVIQFDQAEFANWARPPALFKPELGVRLALRRLPPAFRQISCFWQITGSAGFKDGFRLRTWHWLSRSVTGADLKCWLSPAIERSLIDPCTLVEVQPHYIGCTVLGGPDPCPERFGLLEQAEDIVTVPDVQGIRRRQEQRQHEQRRARLAAIGSSRSVSGGADTEGCIEGLVAALQRASGGTRHYTYKTALARAKALCDRRGLAWAPVLCRLKQAYESTLSQAEIRERQKGSIDGLPDWLERRAS